MIYFHVIVNIILIDILCSCVIVIMIVIHKQFWPNYNYI